MPSVNIYIECSITGIKPADGKTVTIIEFVTQSGKIATKTLTKEVQKKTVKEAVLMALNKALKQLNKPCEVTVYLSERYIYETIQHKRMDAWKANHWKNAKGKPVAYKELWQQYREVSSIHHMWAAFNVHHSYVDWMKAQCQER